MTHVVAPSATALARAQEPCEWESLMWAVLWDTQPDDGPRIRHLCIMATDKEWLDHPALFATRREAMDYIRQHFAWCLDPRNRRRPRNNRLPKPYRVRVRITIPAQPVHVGPV